MGTTPRSIQALLHEATPEVADLLGRARFLERIRQAILEVLPDSAAPHVQVAAYEQYRLRLHVSHASWATRLRYMQPAIVQQLARTLRLHIDTVQVKVRTDARPAATVAPPRYLSDAARQHLRRTARCIDDAPLAAALSRLAEAGRRD